LSFDVFGDFAERGYLRNFAGSADLEKVKVLEHQAFQAHVERALNDAAQARPVTFETVKQIHKTIFADVYPWAGQDRQSLGPDINVGKGGDFYLFSPGRDVNRAIDYALRQGNDPAFMRQKPGEVMGSLAFAHPFLDGNGRTIMVAHTVMAQRAGISIAWEETGKSHYLAALTNEMKIPGDGHLDRYLKPYIRPPIEQHESLAQLLNLKGLGPGTAMAVDEGPSSQKQKPQSL
jgi:cell filamentation protein